MLNIVNNDANYCGTIVKVKELNDIPNMDNCLSMPIFGYNAIVSKTTKIGDYGIVFGPETQLSEAFCHFNNLFSNAEENIDKNIKGYLGANRRVRSIKLRGNFSTCLFMPISALAYLEVSLEDIKEGDSFTSINGVEICKKYFIQEKTQRGAHNKKFKERIDDRLFPKHIKTLHLMKELDKFDAEDDIVVTCKLHGTSGRFTHQLVDRKLSLMERFLSMFVNINKKKYELFCGTRNTIKYDSKFDQNFYGHDVWEETLNKIKDKIPKNYVIYGEIIGWAGEKEIQKNYTYCLPKNHNEFYVYRISIVNEDGIQSDLSWDQLKTFCAEKNLKVVPEVWRGKFKNFDHSIYENKNFYEELGFKQCLRLDSNSPCDEGVVVRKDGVIPFLTKFKSPKFLIMETKLLDENVVSMEDES